MDVAAVLDEIGIKADVIAGLRVHPWGEKRITVPALLLPFPPVDYDQTYGRGSDKLVVPAVIAVGSHSARASRNALSEFVRGSGPKSVPTAVNSSDVVVYSSCDSVRVVDFTPDVVRFNDADYLGGVFSIEVSGKGAT